MKTIAILSEKGGAGKTTLAVHLATAAHMAGLSTAIIDLDPQASAADWADSRNAPPEAISIQPARLESVLAKLEAGGCRFVVLDTGRDSSNAGYTAAKAADMVLIPCRVGRFDIRALSRTLDIAKLAGKAAWLLLNGLAPNAAQIRASAIEALSPMGCEIAPVFLSQRALFRDAPMDGKTAQEAEPDSTAAREVAAVFAWVSDTLVLSNRKTA